jgi:hypothetical protein
MLNSTSRSLMLLAGAWLLSTPGISQAGGLFFPHHHGQTVTTTTTTTSGSAVLVAPSSTFTTTALVPAATTLVPAASYVRLVPAASYTNLVPAASYTNLVPAASYTNLVPAAGYANPTPLSALAAPASSPSYVAPAAMAASVSSAMAASPQEVLAAQASYPALAQAAQQQGLDGGRVVLFLKNIATKYFSTLGSKNVKAFVNNLITTHLGALSGPVSNDVDRLIDELFGATDTSSASDKSPSGGQCFTIRVCIDGTNATATVENPTVTSQPGGQSGTIAGTGKIPSMAPLRAAPSGQAGATPQARGTRQSGASPQGRAPGAGDEPPPAPLVPAEVPADTPSPPVPVTNPPATPPSVSREETLEKQHREVMAALNNIAEALKELKR